MKRLLLLLLLFMTHTWAVEPLQPRSVSGSCRETMSVAVSQDVTTMMVFPEPVSMIVGAGLTDGASVGQIQFDHRPNSPVVTFQALQSKQEVFAQILSGETVYFIRLKPDTRPDSVVTISGSAVAQSREVAVEEVFSQRLALPEERLRQLVELARSASVLSPAMPDEYQGSVALDVSMLKRIGELETVIVKIHRFPKEDSIVFFGTITNRGKAPVSVSSSGLSIMVGTSRNLVPNWCAPFNRILRSGESIRFECVVAGDGQGNRLYLSARNPFTCTLATPSNF